MSHDVNGAPAPSRPPVLSDLRSWAIAYTDASQGVVGHVFNEGRPVKDQHGQTLGHTAARDSYEDGGWVRLFPAWKLVGGYQIGPQGAGRMLALLPLEMLVDLRSWSGRPSSLLRLGELSEGDFKDLGQRLLQGVEVAESMRAQMRGQRSGILVAPANAKLPPLGRQ